MICSVVCSFHIQTANTNLILGQLVHILQAEELRIIEKGLQKRVSMFSDDVFRCRRGCSCLSINMLSCINNLIDNLQRQYSKVSSEVRDWQQTIL